MKAADAREKQRINTRLFIYVYGGGHKYASNCFNFQGEIITKNVNDLR